MVVVLIILPEYLSNLSLPSACDGTLFAPGGAANLNLGRVHINSAFRET